MAQPEFDSSYRHPSSTEKMEATATDDSWFLARVAFVEIQRAHKRAEKLAVSNEAHQEAILIANLMEKYQEFTEAAWPDLIDPPDYMGDAVE